MLRSLVLVFLGVNIALFFWMRSNPQWGQAEREPQRLQRQISPSSIQVLPDLPTTRLSPPGAAPNADAASSPSAMAVDVVPAAGLATATFGAPAASTPSAPVATTGAQGRRASAATPGRSGAKPAGRGGST